MAEPDPVYVWRYVLRSRTALNARSGFEVEGALIRVGEGFGCLQPWPQLGDPVLDELLDLLSADSCDQPLVERAVAMADLDARFRQIGMSLFDEVGAVPESHGTVLDFTSEGVEEAVRSGYWILKVKGDRDYPAVAVKLDEFSRRWPALMWRIDFNGVLEKREFLHFVECLTDHVWKRIDFVEDPCPYDQDDWEEIRRITSLDLACDTWAREAHPAAQVRVLKPARENVTTLSAGGRRLVVTSNMDHPLGQCFAAIEAARLQTRTGSVDRGGLQTHGLFEPDAFTERLGRPGPRFHPPGGTGLGFDDLLECLRWERLE